MKTFFKIIMIGIALGLATKLFLLLGGNELIRFLAHWVTISYELLPLSVEWIKNIHIHPFFTSAFLSGILILAIKLAFYYAQYESYRTRFPAGEMTTECYKCKHMLRNPTYKEYKNGMQKTDCLNCGEEGYTDGLMKFLRN